MALKRVEGKKVCDVVLYALSTCVWCRKTKAFLGELGVEYCYIDVDLLEGEERAQADREVEKWNPSGSFPTMVVDGKRCVRGYKPEEIREALGL